MRVISGERKGRRLASPKKARVRPTSDRVKESIFNVLQTEVVGKRVLDLFSGAGSLGIEALSRGAESATFVDASRQSMTILKKNLRDLDLENKSTILRLDGLKALTKLKQRFDLVFADPPYLKGLVQRIVDSVAQSEVLEKNGLLILEHHKKEKSSFPQESLSLLKQKRFGDTVITFLMKID
jgi:16S rRNA (guanine(966)-N(2))-methyltransferase RsmD